MKASIVIRDGCFVGGTLQIFAGRALAAGGRRSLKNLMMGGATKGRYPTPSMTQTQCLAWKIDDKRMDTFIGGPKFHLPLRCDQPRIEGDAVCAKCLGRRAKPQKKEGTYPQKWWGLVTEPIQNIGPQINKMVYSPWFLEKAKQYSLSEESMARAKKMYATAVAGVEAVPPPPPVPEAAVNSAEEIPVSLEKPKKAGRKKKEAEAASAKPETVSAKPETKPEAASAKPEAKPKKKPGPKKAAASGVPAASAENPLPPVTAIVENPEPLDTSDTVFIKVRKFHHNEKSYLYDSAKHKLYDTKTFAYLGRWDTEKERIVSDIPDSDAEC